MGRTEKKEQLVHSARYLFSKYGIRKVTVEEICRNAGVSKVTFYKNFKNKAAIAGLVFERIFNESESLFDEIVNADISFPEKIQKLILMKEEQTRQYSEAFLSEWLSGPGREIQQLIRRRTDAIREKIISFLKEAQHRGQIRSDIEMSFLLFMMQHFTEMLEDERLRAIYPDTYQAIMETVKHFFYGIMPR